MAELLWIPAPESLNHIKHTWLLEGNKIQYPWDVFTPTADLITAKILFHSSISTPGAKFFSADIKNFYLNTLLDQFEYMKLPIGLIPEEINYKYNIKNMVNNSWVCIEIQKSMYSLQQAGVLANRLLNMCLTAKVFYLCQFKPGLWHHMWQPISFLLVVDDFGIKYNGIQHATYPLNILCEHYEISMDWGGTLFCGIHFKCDYKAICIDLSMPQYIQKALVKFHHPHPLCPQHLSHKYTPIIYGNKTSCPLML